MGHFRRRSHRGSKYPDRKSTRLNSSHLVISYAVFCLKKKNNAAGWFIVYDTLTRADDRLEEFHYRYNSSRDYSRDLVRMYLADAGRDDNYSHADYCQ